MSEEGKRGGGDMGGGTGRLQMALGGLGTGTSDRPKGPRGQCQSETESAAREIKPFCASMCVRAFVHTHTHQRFTADGQV